MPARPSVVFSLGTSLMLLFGFVYVSTGLDNSGTLVISVYDVSVSAVEIDWQYDRSSVLSLVSCKLFYGPVSDSAQVKVFTGVVILAEQRVLKLTGLENNVTYHLQMACTDSEGNTFHSNDLQFTTGSKALPMSYIMQSSNFRGPSSISRESFYSRDDDHLRSIRSSNVILGAVCGIVGFLIINVTIVMVVRKYSHRQMQRRRMMQLENRDYDELPYLRGYE